MSMAYVVGVHLAPVGDASTVAVVRLSDRVTYVDERDEQAAIETMLRTGMRAPLRRRGDVARRERCFAVVHLARLPLDASYQAVAATLADLLGPGTPLRHATLAVDGTAVGPAATDELRAAGVAAAPWTITATDSEAPGTIAGPALVTLLSVLLQNRRLTIAAALPLAPVLTAELAVFTVTPSPLVAALALAVWRGDRAYCADDFLPVRAS
jgi:hypothetical protein